MLKPPPRARSTKTYPMDFASLTTAGGSKPHPAEHQVLMPMMELLVQDFSYSAIVSDLNEKGFRMSDGRPWSRVAVFNMIPRLIEVGPRFFTSEEWEKRRQRFARVKAPDVG